MNPIPFVDFCEQVLRVQLTLGQRTLARVAFDGVDPDRLDAEERAAASRLLGPVDTIPPEARLVLAIVKGARIGGSYIFGALYSLWRALTADLSPLAPGEVAVALLVAPDLRLARQTLRYAIGAAESVPTIARCIHSQNTEALALRRPQDGRLVVIECLPATRGGSAVRGRSLVSAVLSEAAFFRDESAAVNDADIFKAVMPRVMPGGMTVLESTPWVEAGLLFDLYSRNFGTPLTAIAALAPTLEMRTDQRTRLIVEAETARDPENAAREFGAQFVLGGSGLFFGPDLLRGAMDHDLPPARVAPPGSTVSVGGDIGLVNDASAVVAVAAQGELFTLCAFEERRPTKGAPLKLSSVVQDFCAFAARFGEQNVTVDHHELEAGREHLPPGFVLSPCEGGADAKAARFLKARELFRQGQIRIPGSLSKVTNQLSLIVSKPKPGGGTSIVLPRRAGTHLDIASAFILALDAASGSGGAARFLRAMAAYEARSSFGGFL